MRAVVRKRVYGSGKTVWVTDCGYVEGRSGNKKRHTKVFQTKREALEYAHQFEVQHRRGQFVLDSDSVTVAKAAQLFLEAKTLEGIGLSTYKQYEQHVRIHINPRLGSVKLSKLSAADVWAFLDDMLQDNSKIMTQYVLQRLNQIIKFAMTRQLVGRNVIADAGIKAPSAEAPMLYRASKQELAALMSQTEGRDQLLLKLALFTGMRKGELRALRWSDVEFRNTGAIIHISRSARFDNVIKDTKSKNGRRSVPVGPDMAMRLKEWKLQSGRGESALVFSNGKGNVENDANISNRIFYPAMKAAGLVDENGAPLFRFHDLRHAAAALFIEDGLNAMQVMKRMGHASIQTTFDVYGNLFKDDEAELLSATNIESRFEEARSV